MLFWDELACCDDMKLDANSLTEEHVLSQDA